MKKSTLLLPVLFLSCLSSLFAQQQEPQTNFFHSKPDFSKSIMAGGMYLGASTLFMTKAGLEYKHWGLVLDITRDDYREKWSVDNSKGHYLMLATGLAGRYYLRPQGRSLYAEIGAGFSNLSLRVTDRNGMTKKVGQVSPLINYGLGWRFGKKPRGLFGEVGFRAAMLTRNVHLYTDEQAPADAKGISYHAWYTDRFKASAQVYAGIGISF